MRIKLADKAKPLETLGKYLGTFKDKVDHEIGFTAALMQHFFDLPPTTGLPAKHGK